MSKKIEDYALIGDRRSASLVARDAASRSALPRTALSADIISARG